TGGRRQSGCGPPGPIPGESPDGGTSSARPPERAASVPGGPTATEKYLLLRRGGGSRRKSIQPLACRGLGEGGRGGLVDDSWAAADTRPGSSALLEISRLRGVCGSVGPVPHREKDGYRKRSRRASSRAEAGPDSVSGPAFLREGRLARILK